MERQSRITDQMMRYWYDLREERRFPSISEFDPADIQHLWPDCFMMEVKKGAGGKWEHHYTFMGDHVRDMLGGDISGEAVIMLTDRLSEQYREVRETRQALLKEGSFHNLRDEEIRYRQVLLPFGETDDVVDHIVVGMRYLQTDEQ